MLTKPLNHLRPLLRLPSHSSSPDHFSSNPSLLHHLPSGGSSQSLVSAQQAHAAGSTSGSSAGASGRAGWGAGGSGGYTGHARAFLSLQHTGSVDPSSSLAVTSDDNRPTRHALLLKHRLAKRTQLIGIEDESSGSASVGRSVHRQIEARSGQRLGIVDIDARDRDEARASLSIEDGHSPTQRRRSSIAFPAPTAAYSQSSHPPSTPSASIRRSDSPLPSRSSTPGSPSLRAVPRSQSTLELWNVGISSPQPRQFVRTLSTRAGSSTAVENDVDDVIEIKVQRQPPASTRILGQPNRVLMDLAGLDLPGIASRPAQLTRRNSSAAMHQTEETEIEAEHEAQEVQNPADLKKATAIQKALRDASSADDVNRITALIQHYRSARTATAFSDLNGSAAEASDKSLALELPLPEGYDTPTYNACLEALVHVRQPGHSIAPILEIYNELLERGCVPDGPTYSHVIRALSQRESDVSKAAQAFQQEQKWARWRAEKLGLDLDVETEQAQAEVIEAYKAERNFENAFKLWSASVLTQGPLNKLSTEAYVELSNAAAESDGNHVQQVRELGDYARRQRLPGNRLLQKYLFTAMANVKQSQNLATVWSEFEENDKVGKHNGYDLWMAERNGNLKDKRELQRARAHTWLAGAKAFLAVGNVDKALDIVSQLVASTGETGQPPRITPSEKNQFVLALADMDVQKAIEWYDQHHTVNPEHPTFWTRWVEKLVYLDQLDKAVEVFQSIKTPKGYNPRLTLSRLFTLALNQAIQSDSDPNVLYGTLRRLSKDYPLDVNQLEITLGYLVQKKEYDLVPKFVHLYEQSRSSPDEAEAFGSSLVSVVETAQDELSLRTLINIAESIKGVIGFPEPVILAVANKYLHERRKVASAKDLELIQSEWRLLLRTLIAYPASESELDDHLIKFSEDLGELITESGDALELLPEKTLTVLHFAQQLTQRFGRERAISLLEKPFGKPNAEAFTTPEGAAEPEAESDVFELPASPTTMPEPLPSDTNLILHRQLSAGINRHAVPRSNVTVHDAYDLLQRGLAQGHVAHPDALGQLLDNMSRTGDEAKTRELYGLAQYVIQNLIPAHLRQSSWLDVENSMLIAACHLGHLEEAGMYRARIVNAGLLPSADAYATMIACSKDTTDDALVARELFDESRAVGVRPNLFLYNTIISKLSKARKAEMALDLFKYMKAAGVSPSSVTYGAVINACCRVGDGESAAILFEEMSSRPDFKPRVPPFNTMMQFHLTTQPSREKVLYYFGRMQQARVFPSAHTYKLLLDAYAVLPPADFPSMQATFDRLCTDRKVGVQGTHWASLISAHGIFASDVEKALEIFNSIPTHKFGRVDLSTEPVVWEAILNVLAQKGSVEQMEDVRNRMIQSGARATAYVYNVLISGYARAGQIDRAREVFESMGDSVVGVAAPNNHPLLLTSSGHVKPATITDIPTPVVYREPSTYETMIRAELVNGSREHAEQVCKRMEARRYPVAVFMRARALLDDLTLKALADGSSHAHSHTPSGETSTVISSEHGRYQLQEQINVNYDASVQPSVPDSLAPESEHSQSASERYLPGSGSVSSESGTVDTTPTSVGGEEKST